jgi:Fe-S cluster assembly protein SufD
MTASSALADRIVQEHAASGALLPSSVVSAERRSAALELLRSKGLPTSRDENWKYANLRPLEKTTFRSVAIPNQSGIALSDLPPTIAGYARYVFVDGAFAPGLSATRSPNGVTVTAGAARESAAKSGTAVGGDDRFALLNEAFATDAALVHVPRGAECTACVEILFVATEQASNAASYPRLEIEVESNARVGLIERHISAGNDANFVNAVVQVNIGAGAQVDHYRLQQAGARATWIDTLTAKVDKDARYAVHFVALGGQSTRSTSHVQLIGERAETAFHVVSLADGQQVQDGYALVEHIAPNTKSEHSVRGIAAGRSRVAFNSKVVVRERAKGTDSKQSLRGLLAGAQAEIDVRPQLEIYTDDVRCNHGATAGKLDDNMLFYMLSRGIEREVAQQLLKWAFLEDVVSRIAVPELRKHIEQSLAGQLKETAALKELI